MLSEMKNVRRYFGGIPEVDWEVHDVVEGIVPFRTLEWSGGILGKSDDSSEHGNDGRYGNRTMRKILTIIS